MFLFYIGLSDPRLEDNEDIVGGLSASLAAQIWLFNNQTGHNTLSLSQLWRTRNEKIETIYSKLSATGGLHDLTWW